MLLFMRWKKKKKGLKMQTWVWKRRSKPTQDLTRSSETFVVASLLSAITGFTQIRLQPTRIQSNLPYWSMVGLVLRRQNGIILGVD